MLLRARCPVGVLLANRAPALRPPRCERRWRELAYLAVQAARTPHLASRRTWVSYAHPEVYHIRYIKSKAPDVRATLGAPATTARAAALGHDLSCPYRGSEKMARRAKAQF